MLDSISIVHALFCMLPPPIQHLVYLRKCFVPVDEPKYRRNTSLHHVTKYVRIKKVTWLHLNYLTAVK